MLTEKQMADKDTIAAISTPYGTGAIAVVRMSGQSSFDIAAKIFRGAGSFQGIPDHKAACGTIVEPETGEIIDEVVLLKMGAPNTFTAEDIVEIDCHGGLVVQGRILALLLKMGARPAEAGEFTKRAFLNGRIDLAQAEAVIDLINSKTELGSKTAVKQLEGKLSRILNEVRSKLIELLARIEVTVDYPEHDLEAATGETVSFEIKGINALLDKLLKQFERGRILREGINVVIAGRPNVGKSSLLNYLTGKDKALVTDIPGTTRDIIDEYISIKGMPVRIVDTAGIRETADVIEKLGVEKTMTEMEDADLIILMLEAEVKPNADEIKLISDLSGRRHIIVINKIDNAADIGEAGLSTRSLIPEGRTVVETSLTQDKGIDMLENKIAELFMAGNLENDPDVLLTNIRHKMLAEKARASLEHAMEAYNEGMPLDIMTMDIRDAAQFIGEITGESVSEAVINEIFTRFCVGK